MTLRAGFAVKGGWPDPAGGLKVANPVLEAKLLLLI